MVALVTNWWQTPVKIEFSVARISSTFHKRTSTEHTKGLGWVSMGIGNNKEKPIEVIDKTKTYFEV